LRIRECAAPDALSTAVVSFEPSAQLRSRAICQRPSSLPSIFRQKPKARGGSDRKFARAVRSASVTSTAVCRRCSMTRAIPQRSGLSRISTTNSMGEVPNSHRWKSYSTNTLVFNVRSANNRRSCHCVLIGAQKLGWQHCQPFAHDWINVANLIFGVNCRGE